MYYCMCKRIKKEQNNNEDDVKSPFGTGAYQNLSTKLIKYVITNDDKMKRVLQSGNCLWFDSIFESGNLLQA